MTTTFVTVVRPPKADQKVLADAVRVLACAARTTFSWLYQKERRAAEVKREVCARFGILARHWSGCRSASQAAAKSWREGGKERLQMLATRLKALEERWPADCVNPAKKRRNAVGRRKAETAIARLDSELKGKPRWCFGGRRLLRRGHLREWRRRRDAEALFCGEAGKNRGNEIAQWSVDGTLKLRLPDASSRKHLVLHGVTFSEREQPLIAAAVEARQPVTWRVKLLQQGKVQLCVTLEEPERRVISDAHRGAIGVDLNRHHLAVAEVSPDGRLAGVARLALPGGSDAVWQAAKDVVARASKAVCPIVVENLDFRAKKAWLRSYGKRFAEVLSLFRSRQVRDAIEREARRTGIEVRYVDPAWTSRLGNLKYRRRCRVGIHHAAALVIGRRGLGFGERLPEGHPSLTRTVTARRYREHAGAYGDKGGHPEAEGLGVDRWRYRGRGGRPDHMAGPGLRSARNAIAPRSCEPWLAGSAC